MKTMLTVFAHPLPWVLLVALWLGAALARATRRTVRDRQGKGGPVPGRFAGRRGAVIYLVAAFGCALAALVVVGPASFADAVPASLLAAGTVVFFLAFRFKRTAGVTTVVLAVALAITVLLFIQSLTAFTGETEIGRVHVLGAPGDRMLLEVTPTKGRPVSLRMDGAYFAPVVRVVIFDDWLVFLGARTWYRFEGISSFATEDRDGTQVFRQQDTDSYFPDAPGLSRHVWTWYERHEGSVPGVHTVQVEMDLKLARPEATYSLRIQNDGGLQIVPLEGGEPDTQ